MKKVLSILLISVVLATCGGNTSKPVNAPELQGLGSLRLGMLTSEAISAIQENSSAFQKPNNTEDKTYYLYMVSKAEDGEDYKEKESTYYVSDDMSIQLTLGFYKDTLQLIRVRGRWGSDGAGIVRDAFKTKYGDGELFGDEKSYLGFTETWRSENVEAVYYLQDDKNTDQMKRKILEYVELRPTKRDIKQELSNYDKLIKEEKERQRKASFENL